MATEIPLPTLLAEAVNYLGFDVSSNKEIKGEFNNFNSPGFEHRHSVLTYPYNGSYETLSEDLNNVFGQEVTCSQNLRTL